MCYANLKRNLNDRTIVKAFKGPIHFPTCILNEINVVNVRVKVHLAAVKVVSKTIAERLCNLKTTGSNRFLVI